MLNLKHQQNQDFYIHFFSFLLYSLFGFDLLLSFYISKFLFLPNFDFLKVVTQIQAIFSISKKVKLSNLKIFVNLLLYLFLFLKFLFLYLKHKQVLVYIIN